MVECRHRWEMTAVQFGFVSFEKCFHCNGLRTYFSFEQAPFLGDDYREGDCFWSRVENAQSFRFGLRCVGCGRMERYEDLMGLLHCTSCQPECRVEVMRQELEAQKTWPLVAFGFIEKSKALPIPPEKLDVLTDYFNQRRDTRRSRVRILSFELIPDFSGCRGDFLHDVGMLSLEPPPARKHVF